MSPVLRPQGPRPRKVAGTHTSHKVTKGHSGKDPLGPENMPKGREGTFPVGRALKVK